MKTPVLEFFKNINYEPNTGCWIWGGAMGKTGYGTMIYNFKATRAHRIAYQIYKGLITDPKMNVLHKCDVRCCVNPDHLFLGTQLENMKDRNVKGRTAKGSNASNAKLTEIGVIVIREASKNGHRNIDIANYFKVVSPEPSFHNIAHRCSITFKII